MHVDVAVIGAGPAGLAAAIRARWVKTWRGVPCSTMICDPAPPGGLARFRSTRLTGPGFHLGRDDIVGRLLADVRSLHIPLVERTVAGLAQHGRGRWRVLDEEGTAICDARAVVLAPGLRRLSNEAELFGRGLSLTYNGFDFLAPHLAELVARDGVRQLLIVGNERTRNLLPVVAAARRPELRVVYLLDEAPSAELRRFFGPEARFGRPIAFRGEARLEGLDFETSDGRLAWLECEAAFIDYAAFELRPEAGVHVPGLERDTAGFVRVDREGRTNLPGLFAAGDITGLYAMALKALSEGSVAGFSAYRSVFRQKFGYGPPLFAYAGRDAAIDPEATDYPELRAGDRIELLGDRDEARQVARRVTGEDVPGGAASAMTVTKLRARLGRARAEALVTAWLDEKLCTLQPQKEEARRGPARRA